jgi:ribosome-associated protein
LSPKYSTDRETLEKETDIEYLKGTGPGGQHKNKKETGVRLTHEPSGVTVTGVERRSRAQNLDNAFDRLVERLTELNKVPKRRRPTRPSRAAKERRVVAKKHIGEKKAARKPPDLS